MNCNFGVYYYCDHCGERHATDVQYSRELESLPEIWDTREEWRDDPKAQGVIGHLFACDQFPKKITKIQDVDELTIYRIA